MHAHSLACFTGILDRRKPSLMLLVALFPALTSQNACSEKGLLSILSFRYTYCNFYTNCTAWGWQRKHFGEDWGRSFQFGARTAMQTRREEKTGLGDRNTDELIESQMELLRMMMMKFIANSQMKHRWTVKQAGKKTKTGSLKQDKTKQETTQMKPKSMKICHAFQAIQY